MSPASKLPAKKATNGNTAATNNSPYVNGNHHLMDRGAADYSQSGLSSPYQAFVEHPAESSPADQASAAQYSTPAQEARTATFPSSTTPNPEYGLPSSARSGTFPEYNIARQPFPQDGTPRFPNANNQSGSSGGMAHSASPSLAPTDGQHNHHHPSQHIKSDVEVPIDPNIAAQTSPTYPPGGAQYSPYPPGHDMSAYQGHPGAGGMYARPDWQYPGGHHGMPGAPYGAHPSPTTTVSSASSAAPGGRGPGGQVYSFVPIPGAQQSKRPRRRYEEIERMYKCGWNGCEKAYGTLNHLNAHVTMQSHGTKRTPEEFKEIRKEWKARKKEEEAARKAEEERQPPPAGNYPPGVRPQLPPIAYQPGQPPHAQGQYPPGAMPDQMPQEYSRLYQNYPPSPYGQGNQMYPPHPGDQNGNFQQ